MTRGPWVLEQLPQQTDVPCGRSVKSAVSSLCPVRMEAADPKGQMDLLVRSGASSHVAAALSAFRERDALWVSELDEGTATRI